VPKTRIKDWPKNGPKGWECYEGTLETYHETGMECMGLVLYRDGFLTPNPDYDPGKKGWPFSVQHWKTIDGVVMVGKFDVIELLRKDGRVHRRFPVLPDHRLAKEDGYRLSSYCRGMTKHEWYKLFLTEDKRARLWRQKKKS